MQESAFRRARQLASAYRGPRWLVGLIVAFFPAVLAVLAGMAVQVLVDPTFSRPPRDSILSWVWCQPARELALRDRGQFLLVLAALTAGIAFVQALLVMLLRRMAHFDARQGAAELKKRIHAQAFRLGSHDALGDDRSLAEELFLEKTEMVRQGFAAWNRAIPHAVFVGAILLGVALAIHLWLTFLAVALVILIWRVDTWLRAHNGQISRRFRERAQHLDELLAETLNLAPLATGYAMSELPVESFQEMLRQQQMFAYRADVHEAARSPWYWMIVLWSVAFFVLIIGLSPTTSVSGSVVLVVCLVGVFFPWQRLTRLHRASPAVERAAREIFHYLDRTPAVQSLPTAQPLARLAQQLRLENVTLLDRRGNKLLDDVTATIPAGRRVAVLSSDRRAPRALAGLLARFYDPIAGRILFDDTDLRLVTIDSVRRQTLLVLSDALLFTGSVSENIGCGKSDFTTDQIHEAAKKALAVDFILELSEAFETMVGEHGHRLEPSQAFRIALARALIRDPSLIVIEELAEPMPVEDEGAVDAAIAAAVEGRTALILPTRLATLRSADWILLFHEGRLAAQGKHVDLLQSSELYRHLNYIRFHPFPSAT